MLLRAIPGGQILKLNLTSILVAGHPVQDISQIGPVRVADIPTAAVDFHVSDIVEEVAAFSTDSPEGPATNATMLKKAMWHCSSGITTKSSFQWGSDWDLISQLQSALRIASSEHCKAPSTAHWQAEELAGRLSSRADAHCKNDPELWAIWLKEAAAVSVWAHRYLERRFH